MKKEKYLSQTIGDFYIDSIYSIDANSVKHYRGICKNGHERLTPIFHIKKNSNCSKCKEENKIKSMIGKKSGKLTVISYFGHRDDVVTDSPFYLCRCDCGNNKDILLTAYEINKERQKSCGCIYNSIEFKEKLIEIGSKRKGNNEFILSECETYTVVKCSNGEFYIDNDKVDFLKSLNRTFYLKDGYVYFKMNKHEFQLHRELKMLGRYNEDDKIIVDHIDGERNNNRDYNLRVTTKDKNPMNCKTYSNNTSGVKGVSWMDRLSKWQVNINVNRSNVYIGIYDNFEDAKNARIKAEKHYFGEYSRQYGKEFRDEQLPLS